MRALKALLLSAFLLAPALAATPLAPQVSNAAGVTVKVTPRDISGTSWEFEIVFDTHVRELDDDLLKTAVLLTGDGSEVAPTEWRGPPPGGHHRRGVLRFPALRPAPDPLALRLRLGGEAEPRMFRWQTR
jgi:hypothetical protein